jgi:Polyketide cyclase / dehydrase and lipid transport
MMIPMHHDNSAEWAELHATVVIDCSPEIVFSFACDPFNDGRWLTNVGNTQQLTPGPIALGSRYRQFPFFLGVPVEVEWEVIEFVANRRIRARSVAGAFAFLRGYDCEPVGPATRITKVGKLHLPPVSAFVTKAAADVLLSKSAERALKRLKILLESAASQRPP